MTEAEKKALDSEGYVGLPGFMGAELLQALRQRVEELFEIERDRAGAEFKQEPQTRRLANLVNKGEIFERMIVMPEILERVGHILGPEFKLGSLNARSANPHSDVPQPLHCDLGAVADEKGFWVANTVWMLDDFTPHNGALRLVPGSHRWGKLPQQALADLVAAHPQEILITGAAGTVVVMNAHLWHGGTANRTAAPRRALHAFYTRSDKPQQQYQKKLLSSEVQGRLSPELRRILALDDRLNDEVSSATTGQSGFLR
ncbi:MAG TPA: phytanoyl-CoA dioxygenase family protein [Terriglobia bacterium]|nr:phytanoyl-CoA dioxygenase family protein [Terriglobia bacterium]